MWFLVLVIYNAVSLAGNKKMRNIFFFTAETIHTDGHFKRDF